MTDTPLRRAARALMLSQSGVDDFDALDETMQAGLLDDVRAVLQAVRRPSEAMCVAGADKTVSFATPGVINISAEPTEPKVGAAQLFEAMVDAAIAEG